MRAFDFVNGARGNSRACSVGLHALLLSATLALGLVAYAPRTVAESSAQRAQLVEMLGNSDFRVRTQAAFSLGRIGRREAVPPLVEALNDRHPAVRAAAAVALGRIGDPRALSALRAHSDRTEAVESQVRRAIALIEERQGGGGEDDAQPTASWSSARHYVELGEVANTSKTKRPGLMKTFRRQALSEMRRLPATVAVESSKRPPRLEAQLRRYRVSGYAVTASLGRLVRYMSPQKVQVRAEVMLAVMSLPQHNYCMTVTGVQAVSDPRSSFSSADVSEMQEEAMAGALREAFQRLGGALDDGQALRCHGKTVSSASRGRR